MELLIALDQFLADLHLADFLFWVLVFFLSWNAYILIFNRGVPNIRTAPSMRRQIIEFLKNTPQGQSGKTFTIMDMGSGNGLFTRHIARALPQAHVVGLEISGKSHYWATMMKKALKIGNAEYHKTDFFAYDVGHVDVIVMYLSAYEMGRMREKLDKELKNGAIVISNRFPLGGDWVADDAICAGKIGPIEKLLHMFQKDAHVYYKK